MWASAAAAHCSVVWLSGTVKAAVSESVSVLRIEETLLSVASLISIIIMIFFFSISVISCSACLSVLPLPTADKDSEPLALRSVWMRGRWNSDLNSMWSLCGHAGWTESDCRLCLISESGIRELCVCCVCVCVCVCRGDGVRICVFIWV